MKDNVVCPVCGIKNDGQWHYLCPKCWIDFVKYMEKIKSAIFVFSENDLVQYIKYMNRHNKEKVTFT